MLAPKRGSPVLIKDTQVPKTDRSAITMGVETVGALLTAQSTQLTTLTACTMLHLDKPAHAHQNRGSGRKRPRPVQTSPVQPNGAFSRVPSFLAVCRHSLGSKSGVVTGHVSQ